MTGSLSVRSGAFTNPAVHRLLRGYGVIPLLADHTNGGPGLDEAVRRLGRAAVPVTALIQPDESMPHVFPNLLNASEFIQLMKENFGDPH